MKRLIKKASVVLSHATKFENFINICKDGEIKPYNSANSVGHSNSLDQDAVYLTRNSGGEFADDCMEGDKYQIGVCLDVNVDENNLLPSYDIYEFEAVGNEFDDKDELTWEDTLNEWDECRYNSSIPLSSVTNVWIATDNPDVISSYSEYLGNITLDKAIEFVEKFKADQQI